MVENPWISADGGSSGVGQITIKPAKLWGYEVVTIASPRSHEFPMKSYARVCQCGDPDVV